MSLTPKHVKKTCWLGIWETGISVALGTSCRTSQIRSSLHQQRGFSVPSFSCLCVCKEQQNYLSICLSRVWSSLLCNHWYLLSWKSASQDKAGGEPWISHWTRFGCATSVVLFWQHVVSRKKERIDLQNTTLICICKAIQSGKKWGGRLEEKKGGIKSLPNWWMKKAALAEWGCFLPNKIISRQVYLKHTLYLATKFLYGALFCRISAVKMQYIPQIAAAETNSKENDFSEFHQSLWYKTTFAEDVKEKKNNSTKQQEKIHNMTPQKKNPNNFQCKSGAEQS